MIPIHMPKLLSHKYSYYILHKLSSAFVPSFIITLVFSGLFGLAFGDIYGWFAFALYIWIVVSPIIFTSGILASTIIDLLTKYYGWARRGIVKLGIYMIIGYYTPIVLNYYMDLENFNIYGVIASLIYYFIHTRNMNKKIVVTLGLVSLLLIITFLVFDLYLLSKDGF